MSSDRHADRSSNPGLLERGSCALDHGLRAAPIALDRKDAELIATEARDDVDPPSRFVQDVGSADDQGVASDVAERVIDLLQSIEVHDQYGGGMSVSATALFLSHKELIPRSAIVDLRQLVGLSFDRDMLSSRRIT
jgi:hypothetical protein